MGIECPDENRNNGDSLFLKVIMSRLPDFEAWAIFAHVAERKSFALAASELGLSKATVSKAIARLEARIATQLLYRTTRRLSLTEAGRRALETAKAILTAGEAVESDALVHAAVPRGTVRLAIPMSFGLEHVAPILPAFLDAYPQISLDLHLSDDQVDLVDGGFDVALRIAALADSTLKVRRLCWVRRRLVGAKSYLDRVGRPTHPRDLAQHSCLGYAYLPTPGRWRFVHVSGEEVFVTPAGPLQANNADALTPSVLAGHGLAIQPDFVVWRDLAAGRLEAVMEDWSLPAIALNVVTPPDVLRPPCVGALIDFLVARLSAAPWADIRDLADRA
jgi:DNA-binding transcriptional LysR family regulator